jgi:hypothetical protein
MVVRVRFIGSEPDRSPARLSANSRPAPGTDEVITIPKNTIISYTSKEEANQLAVLQAFSSLDCFWENDIQLGGCLNGYEDDNTWSSAEYPGTFAGQLGITPPGVIRSYESRLTANTIAKQMAQGSTYCAWGNDRTTVNCASKDLDNEPISVGVDANMFIARTIPAANQLAQQYAESLCKAIDNVGGKGAPGLPGNDGAQKDCGGECYGYYS